MRFLCLLGLALTSCVTSHLEFMAPELRQAGLDGRTIAVGPVISARPESDPTPSETATLEIEAVRQLQQLRPRVRVLSPLELERLTGPMKSRLHFISGPPQHRVLTARQWQRMASHGIHYLLLPELVENRVVQEYDTETTTDTQTYTDSDGKTRTYATETSSIVADSRRYSTLRLRLLDTTTRTVVWQARAHGQNYRERTVGNTPLTYAPPQMPDAPPLAEVADGLLGEPLSRLPK